MKFLLLSILLSGCSIPPVLEMPPVPNKVNLVIDGDNIESDEGGEILLRNYVAARILLKAPK